MKKKLDCYTPVAPIIVWTSLFIKIFYGLGFMFIAYKIYKSRAYPKIRNRWTVALIALAALCTIWYTLIPQLIEYNTPKPIYYMDNAIPDLGSPDSGCGSSLSLVELFQ